MNPNPNANTADLAALVERYRSLALAARVAYFDARLPNDKARDDRNSAFNKAAEQVRAHMPADLAALVQSEHDQLTMAYEQAVCDEDSSYREARAATITAQIAARLDDHRGQVTP